MPIGAKPTCGTTWLSS